MEPDDVLYSYRFRSGPARHRSRSEWWLLWGPIFIAVAFGSAYMVGRFILVLSEDLKQGPDSWGAVLLLVVLVGSVSLVVIAVCAVVGVALGFTLRAVARSVGGGH